jgi:hypothetical protein
MGIDACLAGRTPALVVRDMADGSIPVRQSSFFVRRKSVRGRFARVKRVVSANRPVVASEGTMRRHWLPGSLAAAGLHDVSLAGTPLRRAFGNVSTICIAPPHSGQVGCHASSVTDIAGSSGAVVAVTVCWVATGTTCCCGAGGSSCRMRASLACRVPLARKP